MTKVNPIGYLHVAAGFIVGVMGIPHAWLGRPEAALICLAIMFWRFDVAVKVFKS